MSPDSVGAAAYVSRTNGIGPWSYAGLSPMRFTDPDGRRPQTPEEAQIIEHYRTLADAKERALTPERRMWEAIKGLVLKGATAKQIRNLRNYADRYATAIDAAPDGMPILVRPSRPIEVGLEINQVVSIQDRDQTFGLDTGASFETPFQYQETNNNLATLASIERDAPGRGPFNAAIGLMAVEMEREAPEVVRGAPVEPAQPMLPSGTRPQLPSGTPLPDRTFYVHQHGDTFTTFVRGGRPLEQLVGETTLTTPRPPVSFASRVSRPKQLRHLRGTAPPEKSFLDSIGDAQRVLDAYNSGTAQIIAQDPIKNSVTIVVEGVEGTYVNIGSPNGRPDLRLKTNVFMIQSSASPKVVPVNPKKAQP